MSKPNYTHIAIVIDRSGSMLGIKKDVEGGLNNFIQEQKAVEGEATITMAQFDDSYEMLYDMVKIANVPNFNLVPRGSTALLDAMGRTMEHVRDQISELKEEDRPSKAIFVFITDGGENASTIFNRARVFEMIEALRSEKDPTWDIVFMGANQDAISEGSNLGVRANASYTYAADSHGTQIAFQALSRGMTSYRMKSSESYAFANEDRQGGEKVEDENDNIIPDVQDIKGDIAFHKSTRTK